MTIALCVLAYLVIAGLAGRAIEGHATSPIGLAWPFTLPLLAVIALLTVFDRVLDRVLSRAGDQRDL